jgi:hypothetical protein
MSRSNTKFDKNLQKFHTPCAPDHFENSNPLRDAGSPRRTASGDLGHSTTITGSHRFAPLPEFRTTAVHNPEHQNYAIVPFSSVTFCVEILWIPQS